MPLHSIEFFLFVTPVVIGYWILPQRFQLWFLLLVSFTFILSSSFVAAGVLLVTTFISYSIAHTIDHSPNHKKKWLALGITLLVGQLIFFKYLPFLNQLLTSFFPYQRLISFIPSLQLLIPLGISFYTFLLAGYLVDVYRKKITPERSFPRFSLFASFFPIMSAGPIERGDHLLPQFLQKHTFDYPRVVAGMQLFTFGLFKKLVIADNLAVVVDQVFGSLHEYRGLSLVLTMIFFSWQIYADFSGYTDMARGIAKILGFNLLENFRHPYLSSSLQDFWRRWHISLSSWFRDYLYIPLGGNRHGILRTCIHIVIVFALCGLWHGASLSFLLWGTMHGLILSLEQIAGRIIKKRLPVPTLLSTLTTYGVVTISWIFFRSPTLADAMYILKNSLVGITNSVNPSYVQATLSQLFRTNGVELAIVLGALFTIIGLELISLRFSLSKLVQTLPYALRIALYSLLIIAIIMLRNAEVKDFIYVQF